MSGKFDFVNTDCYRAALEIGADFYRAIVLRDECTGTLRNLTGYSSKMQIRATSGGTVILAPTMAIDIATATISASATAAVTALLTSGTYYYDWVIGKVPTLPATAWTEVERVLEGKIAFTGRITVV